MDSIINEFKLLLKINCKFIDDKFAIYNRLWCLYFMEVFKLEEIILFIEFSCF